MLFSLISGKFDGPAIQTTKYFSARMMHRNRRRALLGLQQDETGRECVVSLRPISANLRRNSLLFARDPLPIASKASDKPTSQD